MSAMHKPAKIIRLFVSIAVIIGVFLIIAKLKLPSHTYLWREIHNTGHTLLFGAFALAVLTMVRQYWTAIANRPFRQYVFALAITVLSGALVEMAQIYLPGDSDLYDLSRDIAGALAALGFRAAMDRRLAAGARFVGIRLRKLLLGFSGIVLLAALTPLAVLTGAYLHRDLSFPIIADFESNWARPLMKTRKVSLASVSAPPAWNDNHGKVGRLTFLPAKYPTFSIEEPFPDWNSYSFFSLLIFSPEAEIVTIGLRIEDSHTDNSFDDRFNLTVDLKSGRNEIVVPLEKIRTAPKGRLMDMKSINSIHIYAGVIRSPVTLFLDDIRLK